MEEKIKTIKPSESDINIEAKLEETQQKIREDQREIEIRKKNCIFHNLKESESEDKDDRKASDKEAVEKFLETCGIEDTQPVFYTRLGSKSEDTHKIRPLKVIFESEEEKLNLVKKYCHIKRHGSSEEKQAIGEVTIVPDRTIKEREEYKKLKTELEKRVKEGEKNLFIRNYKIRQKQ